MTKLEQLIKELCPNGVRFIMLNTVCSIYDGTHQTPNYTTSGVQFVSVENIGDLYATEKFISEEDYNKYKIKPQINDVLMTRIGTIGTCAVVDRNTPLAYYVSLALLRPYIGVLNSKYLKYYIESKYGRKELFKKTLVNAVPIKVNMGDIGKIIIAVPPIEVQREIVKILDNFTELTAELTARKKQYEYYRDRLLDFGVHGGATSECEWRAISEIAKTNIGLATSVTKHKTTSGVLLLHNSDIQQNQIVLKNEEYISVEFALKNQSKRFKRHDIITVHTGDVGTSAVIEDEYVDCIGFTTITTRINDTSYVSPYYLCYYLNSHICKLQIASMTISDRSNLNQKMFETLLIPIPSLEEQERIVSILDRFDKLCSDISEGLPAEIEARRKQYEYYRDKLLSFEEVRM